MGQAQEITSVRLVRRRLPLGWWAAGSLALVYLYLTGGILLLTAPLLWGWGVTCGISRATGGTVLRLPTGTGWFRHGSLYLRLGLVLVLPVAFVLFWYGLLASVAVGALVAFGCWLGVRSAVLLRLIATRRSARRAARSAKPQH